MGWTTVSNRVKHVQVFSFFSFGALGRLQLAASNFPGDCQLESTWQIAIWTCFLRAKRQWKRISCTHWTKDIAHPWISREIPFLVTRMTAISLGLLVQSGARLTDEVLWTDAERRNRGGWIQRGKSYVDPDGGVSHDGFVVFWCFPLDWFQSKPRSEQPRGYGSRS